MVHQVYKSIQLPIIGLGGICTGEDAVEFLLAGLRGGWLSELLIL